MSLNGCITIDDKRFPKRLAKLKDAPALLYVKGELALGSLSVAIVGCRAASRFGLDTAEQLACELAKDGATIVSGGALGIDGAAHRGALRAGGRTFVVQACGLNHVYPKRHASLFEAITKQGALLSTYAPDTPPKRWQFVQRNRIIAGMADVVVVIEAGLSSGSLYTAAAARKYGRVLCATPGSTGCDMLLADGAAEVLTAQDVYSALDGAPRKSNINLPSMGSQEAKVLEGLELNTSQDSLTLSRKLNMQPRDVLCALIELELSGFAIALPGQVFVRSASAHSLLDAA